MAYYQLFGFLWLVCFIIACTQYVVIVAVSTWYFTSTSDERGNLSLSKGFFWIFRYNLGSLAFGSLIIAIIWAVRICLEYVNKKALLANANGMPNAAAKCFVNATRCCLACFHRFVKYVNTNAYVQVCLTGKGFCQSALTGFLVVIKHAAAFMITAGMSTILSFLGVFTIVVGNMLLVYFLLSQDDYI